VCSASRQPASTSAIVMRRLHRRHRQPCPFEVRIRMGLRQTMTLLGYDRNGDPMTELRIPSFDDPASGAETVAAFREMSRMVDRLLHETTHRDDAG